MPAVPRMVFVVDDDETARRALERLIRSFGWSVQAFGSATACFHTAKLDQPDCIVSKLNMPVMDGAQLTAALAALGIAVPVIIVSGTFDNSAMVGRAQAAGAARILHKPCWDEDLRRSIRQVTTSTNRPMTW